MTTGDLWMDLWALLVALSCLQITVWGSSMAVSDLLTMGGFFDDPFKYFAFWIASKDP